MSLLNFQQAFSLKVIREFLSSIRYLTLWNITEKTIGFFGLGNYSYNVAFLNSFQDIVIGYVIGQESGNIFIS